MSPSGHWRFCARSFFVLLVATGSVALQYQDDQGHLVAWVHIPKCGTSFGTTLAHYANSSLPEDAQLMPNTEDVELEGGPEKAFIRTWPVKEWFSDLLWEKEGNWGDHTALDGNTLQRFHWHLFGLFRSPAARMQSSWEHFAQPIGIDPLEYGKSILGVATKMLAGQAYGLECTWPHRFRCNQVVPDTDTAIARLKAFKFVGLTDEYDLSICLFHAMLGSECLPVEFANIRPSKNRSEVNMFEHVEDPYDEVLYHRAHSIFWGHMMKHGVHRSSCAIRFCPRAQEVFAIDSSSSVGSRPKGPRLASLDYDWPGRLTLDESGL